MQYHKEAIIRIRESKLRAPGITSVGLFNRSNSNYNAVLHWPLLGAYRNFGMNAEKFPQNTWTSLARLMSDGSVTSSTWTIKQHDCTPAESISSYTLVRVVHLGITHSNFTQMASWKTMPTNDNQKYINSFKIVYVHSSHFRLTVQQFSHVYGKHSLYKRYTMKAQPDGSIAPSIRFSSLLLVSVLIVNIFASSNFNITPSLFYTVRSESRCALRQQNLQCIVIAHVRLMS
jgi:hypothetical protein